MSDILTTIIRSKRRTLAIHVLPDQTLLVKAPQHITEREIQRFIENNDAWIQKRTEKFRNMPVAVKKQYKDGEMFLYLGDEHVLKMGAFSTITVENKQILFPQFLAFRAEKELRNWLIGQAQKIITEQVVYYAKQMNVTYYGLTFSDTKSRWGSCSHDDRLQFNWRLIMAPLLVINYVVIHELVHTIEKNHSMAFWNKVRAQSPSYRQQRKWLHAHGDVLMFA